MDKPDGIEPLDTDAEILDAWSGDHPATRADVRSLDALLKESKADLKVWRPYWWRANKWAVGAKHPETGEILTSPLWGVEARFDERHPEAFEPVVQPVQVTLPPVNSLPATDYSGIRRALLLADQHIGYRKGLDDGVLEPFHDRRALDVALQIAARNHFDYIIWLGDLLDSAEWSDKFQAEPEFYQTTQPAICEAAWWLARFRQAKPHAQHKALEGNHDVRPENTIVRSMQQAYRLRPARELNAPHALSMRRLLGLDGMGIEWFGGYPQAECYIEDVFAATHGDVAAAAPGATAWKMSQKWDLPVVFGHIHRRETATRTIYTQYGTRAITAFTPGCMCRLDGVIPGHKRGQHWQQGIGEVVLKSGMEPQFGAIPIDDGQALYNGKHYKARSDAEILASLDAGTDWKY
ncbi:MAG: hypothetical protein HN413_07950 [Chloroflexi bacterium]|jgi:hypothetical protein|nr:hypothetical protein [Chloroflexota bacterium]